MIAPSDCAAIVLAAGRSERYGKENKLLTPFRGHPLAGHIAGTLARVPFAQHIAVVTDPDVGLLYCAQRFERVEITEGQKQGASLQAGLAAVRKANHVLICLADMPFVTLGHIDALLSAARDTTVIATSGPDYRGPPMVFPLSKAAIIDSGLDQGARALLQEAVLIPAVEEMIADIDTVDDFARLGGD